MICFSQISKPSISPCPCPPCPLPLPPLSSQLSIILIRKDASGGVVRCQKKSRVSIFYMKENLTRGRERTIHNSTKCHNSYEFNNRNKWFIGNYNHAYVGIRSLQKGIVDEHDTVIKFRLRSLTIGNDKMKTDTPYLEEFCLAECLQVERICWYGTWGKGFPWKEDESPCWWLRRWPDWGSCWRSPAIGRGKRAIVGFGRPNSGTVVPVPARKTAASITWKCSLLCPTSSMPKSLFQLVTGWCTQRHT